MEDSVFLREHTHFGGSGYSAHQNYFVLLDYSARNNFWYSVEGYKYPPTRTISNKIRCMMITIDQPSSFTFGLCAQNCYPKLLSTRFNRFCRFFGHTQVVVPPFRQVAVFFGPCLRSFRVPFGAFYCFSPSFLLSPRPFSCRFKFCFLCTSHLGNRFLLWLYFFALIHRFWSSFFRFRENGLQIASTWC